MGPKEKLLMRHTKVELVQLSWILGVVPRGTKLDLSKRIAEAQNNQARRDWDSIAKGG